ncbi:unnamed protein product [Boreogadus saida]
MCSDFGDEAGCFGEDHCQFVDSFLDGRTGPQLRPRQLPPRTGDPRPPVPLTPPGYPWLPLTLVAGVSARFVMSSVTEVTGVFAPLHDVVVTVVTGVSAPLRDCAGYHGSVPVHPVPTQYVELTGGQSESSFHALHNRNVSSVNGEDVFFLTLRKFRARFKVCCSGPNPNHGFFASLVAYDDSKDFIAVCSSPSPMTSYTVSAVGPSPFFPWMVEV